jgi:hypothetical protein
MMAEFVILPSGRIQVVVGVNVVATIYPPASGSVRYSLALPGMEGARLVDSVPKARRIVLQRVADWFEACGPGFLPVAEAIGAQAESERLVA